MSLSVASSQPPKHEIDTQILAVRQARLGILLRGGTNRTSIEHLTACPPLLVQRPFYLDDRRPDMAYLFLISVGPGMLQGDHWEMDISAVSGAAVNLTTQAATKIHRMSDPAGRACVDLSLTATEGSFIEFWPDAVILYGGSRFVQRVRLVSCPTSIILCGEILVPGRLASGEVFRFNEFDSFIAGHNSDGSLLFADRQRIQPEGELLTGRGLFGPYPVLGSLYLLRPGQSDRGLAATISDCLAEFPNILGGATELPNSAGIIVRLLGPTAEVVKKGLEEARSLIHMACFGYVAGIPRKY